MEDIDFSTFQKMIKQENPNDGVVARFYDKSVKTAETTSDGLPVFKNVTYVEIRFKDNNTDIFDQPATEEKMARFPVEYARYQLGKKQVVDGQHELSQFAFLTAAEIETLKYRGIFTVEALAGLNDDRALELNLAREKKLAVKFLEVSKNNGAIADFEKKEAEYKAEIEKAKEEIAKLGAELAEKNSKIEELTEELAKDKADFEKKEAEYKAAIEALSAEAEKSKTANKTKN